MSRSSRPNRECILAPPPPSVPFGIAASSKHVTSADSAADDKRWRDEMLESRCALAREELDIVSMELHKERLLTVSRTRREERLVARLQRLDHLQDLYWCGCLLLEWRYVASRLFYARQSRLQAADVAMGLSAKTERHQVATILDLYFQRWASSLHVMQRARHACGALSKSFGMGLTHVAFQNWVQAVKGIQAYYTQEQAGELDMMVQLLQEKLEAKSHEMDKLNGFTWELYAYSKEADSRVLHMEGALGAADKAVEAAAAHTQQLEQEVTALQAQLAGMHALHEQITSERQVNSKMQADLAEGERERRILQEALQESERSRKELEMKLMRANRVIQEQAVALQRALDTPSDDAYSEESGTFGFIPLRQERRFR